MFGLSTVCRDRLSKKIGVTNSEKQKTFLFFHLLTFSRFFFKRFQNPGLVRLLFLQAASLQLQELSLRNLPVSSSTTATPRSPHRSSNAEQGSTCSLLITMLVKLDVENTSAFLMGFNKSCRFVLMYYTYSSVRYLISP